MLPAAYFVAAAIATTTKLLLLQLLLQCSAAAVVATASVVAAASASAVTATGPAAGPARCFYVLVFGPIILTHLLYLWYSLQQWIACLICRCQ